MQMVLYGSMDSFQRTNGEQPTKSGAKRKLCSTDAIVSKRPLPTVDAFTQTVERDGWAVVEYLRHCFEEIEQRKAQGSAETTSDPVY
ncbi:uncharacterized protein LOC131208666 isoform X2 [Anopheles bellator]|uniref:uncharacterized protein LOC131208666 isoform X2 n=1 Tax=Anopheles bellator TaxID=139047 RepID=UPI002648FE5D|nr:uncharacterized protein LOC131208666 isoform X2 [Anopheles bellator]